MLFDGLVRNLVRPAISRLGTIVATLAAGQCLYLDYCISDDHANALGAIVVIAAGAGFDFSMSFLNRRDAERRGAIKAAAIAAKRFDHAR